MTRGLEILTLPSAEPVTLAALKLHARIDTDADDSLLSDLLLAARLWVEQQTSHIMLTQAWRWWLEDWPSGNSLSLPLRPVQSLDAVMLYGGNDSATLWNNAAYQLDSTTQPPRLLLRDGQSWPPSQRSKRGISISFTAGYANAASVPEPLKLAIKQLATSWYEHRGDEPGNSAAVPTSVLTLLAPYRQVRL